MQFEDGQTAVATFAVPAVHCGSCVWLLEQLWRFDPGITRSEVSLQHRTVRVEFRRAATSARRIAEQLAALGYEPVTDARIDHRHRAARAAPALPAARGRRLRVRQHDAVQHPALRQRPSAGRRLPVAVRWTQCRPGAAGAAVQRGRLLPNRLARRYGPGRSASKCRSRSGWRCCSGAASWTSPPGAGPGFLDSFAGLVFFLLIGRLFQQKAFERLAFDRTFRSFLPLSVHSSEGGAIRTAAGRRAASGRLPRAAAPRDRPRRCPAPRRRRRGRLSLPHRRRDARGRAGRRTGARRGTRGERDAPDRPAHAVRERARDALGQSGLRETRRIAGSSRRASRFGAWFTLLRLRTGAGRRDRLVAGRRRERDGRHGGAHRRVPVRADALRADHARHRDGPARAPRPVSEACRGRARSEPHRHGHLRQDRHADDDRVSSRWSTVDGLTRHRAGRSRGGWRPSRRIPSASPSPGRTGRTVWPAPRSTDAASRVAVADRSRCARSPGEGLTGLVDGMRVAIGSAAFVARLTRQPVGPPRPHVRGGWRSASAGCALTATPRPGIDAAARTLQREHALMLASGDSGERACAWSPLFGPAMHFRQIARRQAGTGRARAAGRTSRADGRRRAERCRGARGGRRRPRGLRRHGVHRAGLRRRDRRRPSRGACRRSCASRDAPARS